MKIQKNQSKKEKIAGEGFVWDYPVPSEEIGFSVQELNGRVPDKGKYKNKVCNEACYVIKGNGKVYIDDEEFGIKEGDIYFIKPSQKSYVIAKQMKILTITQPNWYKEQCEIVELEK